MPSTNDRLLLIKNGRVLDPATKTDATNDVLLDGVRITEIAANKDAGIVGVSDDGKPVATARLMRQVMDYCNSLDLPVIDHCEDPSLFAGGVMREGPRSIRLGLKGIPAESESI